MYGFVWVLRVAGFINKDFRARLTQNDYSFIMGSKEDDAVRYFQFIGGKLRSGPSRMPTDFALIWRDNQSGGRAMIDMILGKRKALYNAVINGVLILEGEGKYVSLFMETMNQLNWLFRPKKRKCCGKDA
jgi:hypothetical protein